MRKYGEALISVRLMSKRWTNFHNTILFLSLFAIVQAFVSAPVLSAGKNYWAARASCYKESNAYFQKMAEISRQLLNHYKNLDRQRKAGAIKNTMGREPTPNCKRKQGIHYIGAGPLLDQKCVLEAERAAKLDACLKNVELLKDISCEPGTNQACTAEDPNCQSQISVDTENKTPDQAAWEALKKGVTDATLVKLLEQVAGLTAKPVVILKNAVAAHREQTGKNALSHIRKVYKDEKREIQYLGAPSDLKSEDAYGFLRLVGGTVWTVATPVAPGQTPVSVFYHPDPNFKVRKNTSIYSMYSPQCTAERPDGSQNSGPRIDNFDSK